MIQLQTTFVDRDTLAQYLREQFPQAAESSPAISPIQGGRTAAEPLIQQIQPDQYASTRNMLTGKVTRLSPYLRQGVISLAEVRRRVLEHTSPQKAYKLLQEFAWRDYFQRVYARLGNNIWNDIEPYKTGVTHYKEDLPSDIEQGTTEAMCIDSFARDLKAVGYLHNHARMWTAAYVVHHRRVRWQAGAYWFLQHLLDGDPASNNLSWQWVASTFAAKPYSFNRENLARFTENKYCSKCPLAHGGCPFEGSYEDVSNRIFPDGTSNVEMPLPEQTELSRRLSSGHEPLRATDVVASTATLQNVLVWINEESLDPYGPALTAHPQAQSVFIFDEGAIESARWSIKRLAFIYECLLEIPNIHIYRGSTVDILLLLIKERGYSAIATTPVVDPRLQDASERISKFIPVQHYPVEEFAPVEHVRDLRRFSRYWTGVESMVVGK